MWNPIGELGRGKNDYLRDIAHYRLYGIANKAKRYCWIFANHSETRNRAGATIIVAERIRIECARSVVRFGKTVIGRPGFQTCNPPQSHIHTHTG